MALLLGADAARIVAPAAAPGSAIHSLRATQVLLRPGQRLTVTYRATLEWSDGKRVDEMIVAAASRDGPPAGAATSLAGEQPVAVWPAPQDPLLPGLGHLGENALDTVLDVGMHVAVDDLEDTFLAGSRLFGHVH